MGIQSSLNQLTGSILGATIALTKGFKGGFVGGNKPAPKPEATPKTESVTVEASAFTPRIGKRPYGAFKSSAAIDRANSIILEKASTHQAVLDRFASLLKEEE